MTQDHDDILDELRAALDVESSPEFRARVRGAIETDAAGPSWRPWVIATTGLMLVVVAVVSTWPRLSPKASEEARPVTTAVVVPRGPAGEGAPVPSVRTVDVSERPRVPRTRVAGPATRRRPAEPEVLVPAGQLQLLLAYADARRASAEIEADHVAAPVIDVLVPEAMEVVAAPIVDVIKG